MRLSEGVAKFEMKEHYASEEEAKSVVEEFLRAWEIDSALRIGGTGMLFAFERAQVIDRNPPPPGTVLVAVPTGRLTVRAHAPTVHVTRRAYPAPPAVFRVSPDVETLWQRYQFHRQGSEPLPGMAYFCLTRLEASAGGPPKAREKAVTKYAIDKKVLDKLGELSSERGDPKTARKATAMARFHTPAEVAWTESAIRAIIRRVGEVVAGATGLPVITMKDLPRLP